MGEIREVPNRYFKIRVNSGKNNSEDNTQTRPSEISIAIREYGDIFSDFDPRPFSNRALSDDFLLEVKRASLVKPSNEIELKFLIPEDKRNLLEEGTIKKRLHEYFKKHNALVHREASHLHKRTFSFIAIGAILILGATYIRAL